jgi:hypothetical protein
MNGQIGMYVGYRWRKITIKDTNPALPAPIELTISGADVQNEDIVKVNRSHHGLYDSLTLKVPGATYGVGPNAGVETSSLSATYDASLHAAPVSYPITCRSLAACGTPLNGDPNAPSDGGMPSTGGPTPAR